MKAVINVNLLLEDQVLNNRILFYDERIDSIISENQLTDLSGTEVLDGGGLYLSPGLIDLHIHGLSGVDVMDGTRESLEIMAESVASQGVTAFVATTMTADVAAITRAVSTVREWIRNPGPGAELLGVHLEGPFISSRYKGAQNPEFIRNPNYSLVEPWLDVIRIITLAPETPGAEEFIRQIRQNSPVVLSIGHSDATCEQALMAYEAGVRHITHCFNGMSPLHHRAPGVVGAALGWPFTTEIICDDVHVNPVFYQGLLNIKGLEKVIPVTDCMQAGGLADGIYSLGGQQVTVRDGTCRLQDGTLAGSTLRLNQALNNLKRRTSLTLPQLAALASRNPAKVLGIDKDRGTLAVGKLADYFLHDEEFNVMMTVGRGKRIFDAST